MAAPPRPTTTTTTPSHSRSPSPPPAPPRTRTPGPRATALTTIFTTALQHTLQTCSYANFAACFPTPAAHAPAILESVWRQITAMIGERARREFEEIVGERDVVRGLGELERLVREAGGRRREGRGEVGGEGVVVPPHTLPPQQLYLAHLAPYLASTQTELERELRQLQTENESLAQGIAGQKEKVEELVGGLEGFVRDLEGANGVMGSVVEDGGIRREAVEVDGEVGGRVGGSRL